MNKWYVRVDCEKNEKVGTGHLYRTIAFASFLQKKGDVVKFLINNNDLATTLLNKKQLDFIYIDDLANKPLEKVDYLLIDLYEKYKDPDFLNGLRRIADTLIVITDTSQEEKIDADYVILTSPAVNNFYPDSSKYIKGAKYLIMDDSFLLHRKVRNYPIKNILIAFGGYDPFNVTKLVITALRRMEKQFNSVKINILLGIFYPFKKELLEILKETKLDYAIHTNVDDIALFYSMNDYAVTAAGNTLYELSALGIPASVISQTPRQKEACEKRLNGSDFDYIGYYKDVSVDKIVHHLTKMMNNKKDFENNSKAGLRYFENDGKALIYNHITMGNHV